MTKKILLIGKIVLYCFAVMGAFIWLVRFPLYFDWAHEAKMSAVSKRNLESYKDSLIQLMKNGSHLYGFRGQIAVVNARTGSVFKEEFAPLPSYEPDYDRPYLLGSISKTITAIITAQLFEEQLLKEQDTLCEKMFISCPRSTNEITIRQLLDHRSGLPRASAHQLLGDWDGLFYTFLNLDPKARDLKHLATYAVKNDDRTFLYSNLGFRYLTYVLEKTLKTNFKSIVESRINQRYSLASFSVASPENYSSLVSYYPVGINQKLSVVLPSSILLVPKIAPYGDGAVIASLNDMISLSKLVMKRQLFKREETHYRFFEQPTDAYAYGLVRGVDSEGDPYYFHNGRYFGCSTFWYIFPKQEIAVIMLSNMGYQRNEVKNFVDNAYRAALGMSYEMPVKERYFPALSAVAQN